MQKIRISKTLGGGFSGTFQDAWGLETYNPETDINEPCVFAGLYGLPDFFELWRHKGKKYIFWAGSDILHFTNGYWLDDRGEIRLGCLPLAEWIDKNCENYVENIVEQGALENFYIRSKIVPSFLGKIEDYPVSFKPGNKVYTSVSGDDFEKYGWDKITKLAIRNPQIEFHCYGNSKEWYPKVTNKLNNVFVHGRVSQGRMNSEIKEMQGALRLTEFDGCSELIVKAMLWGQYAFSFIEYPATNNVEDLNLLTSFKKPNTKRNWWIKNLNKYPWKK